MSPTNTLSLHPNPTHSYFGTSTIDSSSQNKLNNLLVELPSERLHYHASKERMWNVAKTVTIVGFVTLAGATFVAISVFAPSYIVMTSLAICLALPTAVDGFSSASKNSLNHSHQVAKFTRIIEIQEELNTLSKGELEYRFGRHGFFGYTISDFNHLENGFSDLKIGLATLLYLCERTQQLYRQHRNSLDQVTGESSTALRSEQMRKAYYEERASLANYINAGYIHGILHRPFIKKSLEEIGSMTMLSAEDYGLARLYDRTERPPLFIFNNETQPPLLESDLHTSSGDSYPSQNEDLSDLSKHLFSNV